MSKKAGTGKVGPPFKFKSAFEMQNKIEAYFKSCEPHPILVTEYVWHEVEESYVDEEGEQQTRMANDYSRPPEAVERYTVSRGESLSVTGLALALDTNRQTLLNYEDGIYLKQENDDDYDPEDNALILQLIDTIKKAKARVEHDVQFRLESNQVAGTIFNLKNNFNWIDKQIEEGTQEVVVTTRKHKRKG
jgi:hypothetical protein